MSNRKFLISCRDATLLITKKREKAVNFGDRVRLIVHLMICEFCRRFSKQTRLMEKEVAHLRIDALLTQAEKRRMSELLRRDG